MALLTAREGSNRESARGEMPGCLVVEDHCLIAELLAENLAAIPGMPPVLTATTKAEGIRLSQTYRPTILILDLLLPDGSGLDVADVLLAVEPRARVIVLSSEVHRMHCSRDLHQAIAAVIDKSEAVDLLHEQVRALIPMDAPHGDPAAPGLANLTLRETEVLHLIGEGLSCQAISERLNVSLATAQTHRKNIIAKVGLKGGELILFAARHLPGVRPVRP